MAKFGCSVCRREPEPGYVDMDNNGPTVPCWGCNFEKWRNELRRDDTTGASAARWAEEQKRKRAAE